MSGLETAIRNALERSERENAETRARIYQSARQALETGLRKQAINDEETVSFQRRRLEALIHSIELEERARLDEALTPPSLDVDSLLDSAATQGVASPSVLAPDRREPAFASSEADVSPDIRGGDVRAAQEARPFEEPSIDMRSERAAPPPVEPRPEGKKKKVKAERPRSRSTGAFARLFIYGTILTALGTGAWWVYTSDFMLTAEERNLGLPTPQPRVQAEDFTGSSAGPQAVNERGGFSDEWLDVFAPQQIAAIRPRPNSLVDVVTASDGTAVRILSSSGDPSGAVEITVPTEVLRQMAGRSSTIALTLQSTDDEPVELSVSCDFSRLGDCSRRRFTANAQKADALFRVSFENGMAPANAGRLVINGDVTGSGRGINLYSVRILPGQ
ncbi:hypothetical protein FE840_006785 [Peteryoungia desertarenae]|uniref:Biotin transporter BioY n=1 Tax=Peteryoungia desertarenae TaxID=1813451 RepID=A0ABX6QM10_9HYPH|nr:hypothetical protein [Peteryoungia desertarenae]QLF69270.1 hypothetical protein FE840_006785 [Peteryoungia desertarenae]